MTFKVRKDVCWQQIHQREFQLYLIRLSPFFEFRTSVICLLPSLQDFIRSASSLSTNSILSNNVFSINYPFSTKLWFSSRIAKIFRGFALLSWHCNIKSPPVFCRKAEQMARLVCYHPSTDQMVNYRIHTTTEGIVTKVEVEKKVKGKSVWVELKQVSKE